MNFRLKPYWGKPTVRNFRGGGENTGDLPLVVHAVRPLSTRWLIISADHHRNQGGRERTDHETKGRTAYHAAKTSLTAANSSRSATKAGGNSFTPVPMIFNMPGCAAPLVKSRTCAGICRNLNRILCFHDAYGFSEIGFVRRILTTANRQLRTGGIATATCAPTREPARSLSVLLILPISIMR